MGKVNLAGTMAKHLHRDRGWGIEKGLLSLLFLTTMDFL